MIKLKTLLEEVDDEESINQDKLFWSESYLDDVAESLRYNDDFNKLFWSYPQRLYHCTKPEYIQFIRQKGLLKQSKTRGINNRHIGSSVFTTMIDDEVEHMSDVYGPIVISINTNMMKADGYMPTVEKEPEWARAEKLTFVINTLNKSNSSFREKYPEEFVDSSDGQTQGTVIVYGNIPLKYLSIIES